MSEKPLADNVKTLQDLAARFSAGGTHTALCYFTEEGSDSLTLRNLGRSVDSLASRLRRDGLEQNQTVAILGSYDPRWLVAALAVLRAGGVSMPLDAQLPDQTLAQCLTDADPAFILAGKEERERLRNLEIGDSGNIRSLENSQSGGEKTCDEDMNFPDSKPEDRALMLYTSGTTGRPKGVPLTHSQIMYQIRAVEGVGLIGPGDTLLLPLPFHHVYPLVIGLFTPLALGIPIILPHALTGKHIRRAIREGGVTVCIGVPRFYEALLTGIRDQFVSRGLLARAWYTGGLKIAGSLQPLLGPRIGRLLFRPLHRKVGPQLRILASGGAALNDRLADEMQAIGWQVAIGYGLTETAPLLTLNLPGAYQPGSVGRPVPDTELDVDSEALKEQTGQESHSEDPQNGVGEILARGPGVFSGYHRREEENRKSFRGEWFRTGDIGRIDSKGYLWLEGRLSTLIVTESGKNIQPAEVEEAYESEHEIEEIGILEQHGRLAAVIVPSESIKGERDSKKLQHRIDQAIRRRSGQLPSYQRLSRFVVVQERLPRTRLGKIRRHRLVQLFQQKESGSGPAGDERKRKTVDLEDMSDRDRTLLENDRAKTVWDDLCRRFQDRSLNPDSHLQFELGFDSMEWLNYSLRVRELAGVGLDQETIGRMETVRDLLEAVTEARDAQCSESEKTSAFTDPESILSNPETHIPESANAYLKPHGPLKAFVARCIHFLLTILMRLYFRLEQHEQGEHIPLDRVVILAPNHTGYLDGPALAAVLPYRKLRCFSWAGWRGLLFRNAFMRRVSDLAHVLPVDPDRSAASSLALAAGALSRNRSLVWFPEGQRSPTGELQPLRPGLGLLAAYTGTPVIPVWISGSGSALPVGRWFPRPKKIRVRFGPVLEPVDSDGEKDDLETRSARFTDRLTKALNALNPEISSSTESKKARNPDE